MNPIPFFITLCLAVAFAGMATWGVAAGKANAALAKTQVELQAKMEKARVQQRILEQIIQRAVTLGHADEEMRAFLGKYGLQVREKAPETSPAPAPAAPTPTPEATPTKAKR